MLKLSRADAIRGKAEREVDALYARKLQEALGPLAALHALKRLSAAGDGALADDDADRSAILRRAAEQDERLGALDRERRDMKRLIRAATTTAEIKAIVADLK